MTQSQLAFDITNRKHGGNAESQAAHSRLIDSGKKQCQQEVVHRHIKESYYVGITCRELAETLDVGMNQISGRFSELKRAGRIRKRGVRDGCGVYVAR